MPGESLIALALEKKILLALACFFCLLFWKKHVFCFSMRLAVAFNSLFFMMQCVRLETM
jgi:hypothetical protein